MNAETDADSHARPTPAPAGEGLRPGLRPMAREDIPAVARLFRKIFRGRESGASPELEGYLEAVFLGSPLYRPENGSIVHDGKGQGVTSAILAVPMEFEANGRRLTAKLLCAFMTDGKATASGAARLARHMRADRQDLCFSDNSSPVSADHWAAGGGFMLPVQSLEWRRVFRPASAGALAAGQRLPWLRSPAALAPLALGDRVLHRCRRSLTPPAVPGCRAEAATPEAFFACIEPMTARFSVRPVWSKPAFDWLLGIAAMNRRRGGLHMRTVIDAKGVTIGALLYYGQPGGEAVLLNLLCLEGREFEVVGQMFATLEAEGYAAACGMSQPFLMNAIYRQRWLTLRHRGYFCMATRHADLAEAAVRGDIYVGGLASESWSRLLTDF